ncbi:MAG: hypothetical protein AB7O04_08595, partial [Hyphomonadaceae bacterium]
MQTVEHQHTEERKREAPDLNKGWDLIAFLLSRIALLFCKPAQLAAIAFITRDIANGILQLLLPAEALARRMLLLMAHELPKPAPTPLIFYAGDLPPPSQGGGRGPRFALIAPERNSRRTTQKPFPQSTETIASAPFAARMIALIKVAQNPAPYAKRLARKLHYAFLHIRKKYLDSIFRDQRIDGPYAYVIAEADVICETPARSF